MAGAGVVAFALGGVEGGGAGDGFGASKLGAGLAGAGVAALGLGGVEGAVAGFDVGADGFCDCSELPAG